MPNAVDSPPLADRVALVDWYRRTRRRSAFLFDLLEAEAYYAQPIALRHPIVFYEGHLAAFSLNTLVKKALGRPGIDAGLERLFARGIDPDDAQAARGSAPGGWPERRQVRAFVDAADALIVDALQNADLVRGDVPLLEGGQAVFTIIEHELMHQETMLYMWHQLPYPQKRGSADLSTADYADSRRSQSTADYADFHRSQSTADYADSRTSQSTADYADFHRSQSTADYADFHRSESTADYADFHRFLSRMPGSRPQSERIAIPAGRARLGAARGDIPFGWDNEFEAIQVDVPAFVIDRFNVTNEDHMEFVDAGGYRDQRWWTPDAWRWIREERLEHPLFWEKRDGGWAWRSMFASVPVQAHAPVYVSHAEASAYARWKGARLPTEAEFHRAAYGTPGGTDRQAPWGDEAADGSRACIDFTSWDPVPVGSYPQGRSAWGVDDLVGNGWEWTSTVFGPFPGFQPLPSYPEYSADFFDGQHFVMKGGSPATARELIRPTFRNWFRPHYPYVYATFRCVTG